MRVRVRVQSNPALTSLQLLKLTSVGSLSLALNAALQSAAGLRNVAVCPGNIVISVRFVRVCVL